MPTPYRATLLALTLLAAPLAAQETSPDSTAQRDSSTAAIAESDEGFIERLQVHGYITQGVAGRRGGEQFFGIDERTSTDFRYAALQLRWTGTPRDGFVLQFNHRRLGKSPITDFESNVTANWAFYERRLGDASTVRVGRVPVPRGIYNELRAVGVVLPFYRAPATYYDEGSYYSETVNGVVATHAFNPGGRWGLDVAGYGGGWTTLLYNQSDSVGGYSIYEGKASQAIGTQLWLRVPVDGARLGVSAQTYKLAGWDNIVGRTNEFNASLDVTRERGFARAEAQLQKFATDHFWSVYGQLGANLTSRLMLATEWAGSWDRDQTWAPDYPRDYTWHKELGVGARWAFTPMLVGKLEWHWSRGVQVEHYASPLDPPTTRYMIASLSAAF